MCGIDAVFGKNAIIKALLITIGQLERGTQGTGVAYIRNNKIKIVKEPISPIKFFAKYSLRLQNLSNIAIAHNRAPSVGKVAYENTHPFLACNREFALIHNGTALGYYESNKLRKHLQELGHVIIGQTDSELLTHILEEYYYSTNDYVQALERLYNNELHGAIIILTKQGEIYATKRGFEPLNYVKEGKEIYIASSPQAIANIIYTKVKYDVYAIKSKQILRVKSNGEIEIIGKGEEEYNIWRWDFEDEYSNGIKTWYYDKELKSWYRLP